MTQYDRIVQHLSFERKRPHVPGDITLEKLRALDASGVDTLVALHPSPTGKRARSLASPFPFVCSDGKTYWLKGKSQSGLVVELIAGRIASRIASGPMAKVVEVPSEAVEGRDDLREFVGTMVGIEDVPRTVNSKELRAFRAGGGVLAASIDPASRARVAVFRTWLEVGDDQVLIGLDDGRVYSIDHGECLDHTRQLGVNRVISPRIDGVDDSVGRRLQYAEPALERVEGFPDGDLATDVSCVPTGAEWRGDEARRIGIATWLSGRRSLLRPVIVQWCQ